MTNDIVDVRGDQARLEQLVTDILAEARRQGASDAEVSASVESGLAVNVRMGALETIEFNQDRGFGITVYFGRRKGSASTSDSSRSAIEETVRAAANIARHTQEDPCNGLADADLMARALPDLDLFHPWALDPAGAEALALACETAGREADPRIGNSEGASVSTHQACRVYGNTRGFLGGYVATRHGFSCSLIAADASGMQRDYWYTQSRDPAALESAEAVGCEAARRTVARLAPQQVATGRFPVLFAPTAAGGLIGSLLGALYGGAQYRKASFLLDSLGRTVTHPQLTLREVPHLPCRMGSAAFDGDGVATRAKAFIARGVVESYVLSAYSARRLGLAPTGNAGGVFNLLVEGDVRPVPELLRAMGRGLVVTELMGQGVNGVTGDYSRGAAGFWVEDGAIVYPVDGITIAGNLKDMFRELVHVGDDPDLRGNVCAPSLLIGAMTVAGT
ncbi:MAG: metalloprotease PmbA [Pseudomonadales bacterium]|nr:metalloprotease PmbA [Pseudomonadales bacterium]